MLLASFCRDASVLDTLIPFLVLELGYTHMRYFIEYSVFIWIITHVSRDFSEILKYFENFTRGL